MSSKNKRLVSILFGICLTTLFYAQSEKERYEIYSEVLKVEFEKIRIHGNDPVKIMLIDQYVEKYESGVKTFLKYDVDTVNQEISQEIHTSILPKETLIDRLLDEILLRRTLKNFAENFENHPKLQLNQLDIGDAEIQSISTQEFNSYFKRWWIKKRSIDRAWKRIEKEYQTRFVMEVSKIHFEANFAAIYYNLYCGSLCSFRKTVLLEKNKNQWKIIGEINMRHI